MAMMAITTNSSISVKAPSLVLSEDSAHTVLRFYWVTVRGTLGIRFGVSMTFAVTLLSRLSASVAPAKHGAASRSNRQHWQPDKRELPAAPTRPQECVPLRSSHFREADRPEFA